MKTPFLAQTIREQFAERITNELLAKPENITGFAYAVSSYVSLNDLLMIEVLFDGTKKYTKEIESKNILN